MARPIRELSVPLLPIGHSPSFLSSGIESSKNHATNGSEQCTAVLHSQKKSTKPSMVQNLIGTLCTLFTLNSTLHLQLVI